MQVSYREKPVARSLLTEHLRIRRVKCTEERPSCYRCTSTGRQCDGYAPVPVSRKDLISPIHGRTSLLITSQRLLRGSEVDGSETSSIHLDYFRDRVVFQTNYFVKSGFWDRLLLQLFHREPSVKYAVIALSSLHQHWELNGLISYEADHNALHSYQKALQHANKLVNRAQSAVSPDYAEIITILVVCILFICYEHAVGRYQNGAIHLEHGTQILRKYTPVCSDKGSWIAALAESNELIALVDVMQRLEFMTICFTKNQFQVHMPQIVLKDHDHVFSERFEDYEDARRQLMFFVIWALTTVDTQGPKKEPLKGQKSAPVILQGSAKDDEQFCLKTLEKWSQLFKEMHGRHGVIQNDEVGIPNRSYNFVWILYLCTKAILHAEFAGSEMSYDAHTEEFAEILQCVKSIIPERRSWLSFEDGIVSTLYFVAARCRDPRLRRRAISMLSGNKVRDGVWEAPELARIAKKLMAIEEEGIPNINRPEEIPVTARVNLIRSKIIRHREKIELNCCISTGKLNPEWRFRHEVVHR